MEMLPLVFMEISTHNKQDLVAPSFTRFNRTFVMWSFPWRQRYTVPWFGNGATAALGLGSGGGVMGGMCGRLPKKSGKFKRISGPMGFHGTGICLPTCGLNLWSIHGSYELIESCSFCSCTCLNLPPLLGSF